mmetsp:Transcript_41445/g.100139  ORF Transcript_41445/g.100139 Transcript_41445/m.100139 type:complete len:267 (-) Transcript_41445:955-1755(-)
MAAPPLKLLIRGGGLQLASAGADAAPARLLPEDSVAVQRGGIEQQNAHVPHDNAHFEAPLVHCCPPLSPSHLLLALECRPVLLERVCGLPHRCGHFPRQPSDLRHLAGSLCGARGHRPVDGNGIEAAPRPPPPPLAGGHRRKGVSGRVHRDAWGLVALVAYLAKVKVRAGAALPPGAHDGRETTTVTSDPFVHLHPLHRGCCLIVAVDPTIHTCCCCCCCGVRPYCPPDPALPPSPPGAPAPPMPASPGIPEMSGRLSPPPGNAPG